MTLDLPTGRTVHQLDSRGNVRDWLVSPAWAGPCADLAEVLSTGGDPWGPDGRWVLTNGPDVAPLKSKLYQRHPLLAEQQLPPVVEGGPVTWTRSAGEEPSTGSWRRVHTGTDGFLDWSQFCFTPEYRHAMAATTLEVDQPEYRDFEIRCTGPYLLFVGEELVAAGDRFGYMQPEVDTVRVRLPSGASRIHLATWQVAFREVRHIAGVRISGLPLSVVIDSPEADEHSSAQAEQLLDAIGIGPWANVTGTARISGPVGARLSVQVGDREPAEVELTDGAAVITAGDRPAAPVQEEEEGTGASMLGTGDVTITLRSTLAGTPVYRTGKVSERLPDFRAEVDGTPQQWREELLRHVARTVPGTARALAAHALDPSAGPTESDIATPRGMIDARADCADFEAVGAMHLLHRIPALNWPAGAREALRDSLLRFKYWIDQPGLDAMCYFTENHQFVWHTAETLVGEYFADEVFANSGWTGRQHADHGRELALEWMRRKLSGGFSEYDSNAYLAIDSFALVSLVEFAAEHRMRAMAEALLDKLMISLAANSFHGVHAAAHGRSYAPTQRSSRLEETAPLMRLLWGVGALNHAVLPATSLATARVYRVPPVVREIAGRPGEVWEGRQVYRGSYRLRHDLLSRPYRSDLRIWRTAEAMLSSVQDYRSGLPGLQEHIWGAALSPEVQIYATHPASDTISSSSRPNAWAGHRILPRVRQHRDTVLALHRIPADDWAGNTHLWFPVDHLDQWCRSGSWLAGRVGDGYVAVAAAGGFVRTGAGDEADQRWVPAGDGRAYVATVGLASVDGSFEEFVAALGEPDFGGRAGGDPTVSYRTRDGRQLSLGFTGPFLVDGSVPADDLHIHLQNPAITAHFGDSVISAGWGGQDWSADVVEGRRLVPPSDVPVAAEVN